MLLGENSDHIHKLFGNDVQYEVPRYQRRYVWEETNWQTLWADILSQEKLEPDDRGHFTGNIVTRPITGGQLARYEVIDGQQRLTTFQIIFCVIRDLCESQNHDALVEEAQKHIVNTPTVIENVIRNTPSKHFPDPTYKFIPTDYDKSAFQKVAEGGYGKVIPQASDESENRLNPEEIKKVRSEVFVGEADKVSRSILDAYDYFYEQIRDYVGKDCDYDKVNDLINSIKNHFNLIHITLGSSDQPEKIFESLNATGRMLSEFDYLRNNLFLRAGQLGVDRKSGRSYSDIFYDKYWIFENDSHYWNTDRLESFFRAFLMAELGPEKEGKSLKAFDRYRDYSKTLTEEQRQSVEYELDQLKCYADSYKEMSDPDSDVGCRLQFYGDLNLPRLDSFILFLKHRLRLEDQLLHDVCRILESYIVRRLLCADHNEISYARIDSYEKINAFFAQAIEAGKFNVNDFVDALHGTWPNSDQVRTVLEQAWSKDDNLILYILYRIELRKRELSGKTYEPLGFKVLKSLVRIVVTGVHYYKADSIGNIMPIIDPFGDGWDLLSLKEKKIFLEDISPGLILSQEIGKWDSEIGKWDSEEIDSRTDDLIYIFNAIWPPAILILS